MGRPVNTSPRTQKGPLAELDLQKGLGEMRPRDTLNPDSSALRTPVGTSRGQTVDLAPDSDGRSAKRRRTEVQSSPFAQPHSTFSFEPISDGDDKRYPISIDDGGSQAEVRASEESADSVLETKISSRQSEFRQATSFTKNKKTRTRNKGPRLFSTDRIQSELRADPISDDDDDVDILAASAATQTINNIPHEDKPREVLSIDLSKNSGGSRSKGGVVEQSHGELSRKRPRKSADDPDELSADFHRRSSAKRNKQGDMDDNRRISVRPASQSLSNRGDIKSSNFSDKPGAELRIEPLRIIGATRERDWIYNADDKAYGCWLKTGKVSNLLQTFDEVGEYHETWNWLRLNLDKIDLLAWNPGIKNGIIKVVQKTELDWGAKLYIEFEDSKGPSKIVDWVIRALNSDVISESPLRYTE